MLLVEVECNAAVTVQQIWIKVVDSVDGGGHVPPLDGASYSHAFFDGGQFEGAAGSTFAGKILRRLLVALYDEIVHYQAVQLSNQRVR